MRYLQVPAFLISFMMIFGSVSATPLQVAQEDSTLQQIEPSQESAATEEENTADLQTAEPDAGESEEIKETPETETGTTLSPAPAFTAARSFPPDAQRVQGMVKGVTTWTANAHIVVVEDLYIGRNDTLIIEPGVTVYLDPEISITVQGTFLARGSRENPITFQQARNGQPWGRILFTASSRNAVLSSGSYQSGCIVEHAIVSGGGSYGATYEDGMILCSTGSPYISHVEFTGGQSVNGGAIAVMNGSNPFVLNCYFHDNKATGNGGAIYMSLNSAAIIDNGMFLENSAGLDGGAIFGSFCPASVSHSHFENNTAGRDGGAIALGESNPFVEKNTFRSNKASREGKHIVLRSGCKPIIRFNAFVTEEGEYAVATQASVNGENYTIDASFNYWGVFENYRVDRILYDQLKDPVRPRLNYDPLLKVPHIETPLGKQKVSSISLFQDANYSLPMVTDYVGFESPLYLQVRGENGDPRIRDWMLIDLVSSGGDSIHLVLEETDLQSNLYRKMIMTTKRRNPYKGFLGTRDGETITIAPSYNKEHVLHYPVRLQQAFVENIQLPKIEDIKHVVDEAFLVTWNYEEPKLRRQKQLRFSVLNDQGLPFWESGIQDSHKSEFYYNGPSLSKGKDFQIKIEVSNGIAWSNPGVLTIHRNGVPGSFGIEYPLKDQVVLHFTPVVTVQSTSDPENDPFYATFEIAKDGPQLLPVITSNEIAFSRDTSKVSRKTFSLYSENPAQIPVRSQGIMNQMEASHLYDYKAHWELDNELEDNTVYHVRAHISDHWDSPQTTAWQRFIVNQKNDKPAAFSFVSPQTDQSELLPSDYIEWTASSDTDPEDKLTYIVTLAMDTDDSQIIATAQTPDTKMRVNTLSGIDQLGDDNELSLSVQVRDLEKAIQPIDGEMLRVFYNAVNDTPTVPVNFTLEDSVRSTEVPVPLKWSESTDADHSDPTESLVYEVELTWANGARTETLTTLAGEPSISFDPVPDNSVTRWRVRALDDSATPSAWSDLRTVIVNAEDEAPNDFLLTLPAHESKPYSLGPTTFTWQEAVDPDPYSTVSYTFFLGTDKDVSEENLVVKQELTETSFTWEEDLEHLVEYYWKVVATENTGLTTSSEVFSFIITSTPSVPEWTASLPQELLPSYELKWNTCSDPDPGDVVTYTLAVSANATFTEQATVLVEDIKSTSLLLNQVPGLDEIVEDDESAYFRVKAIDDQGFESDWSEKVSAFVNLENDDPVAPRTKSPKSGKEFTEDRPTFSWNEASDEDHSDTPDLFTYEVMISLQDSPDTAVMYGSGTVKAELTWRPNKSLPDNSFLVWKVRTIDDEGAKSEWSDPVDFSIDRKPESPESFTLISPSHQSAAQPNEALTFTWNEAIDHDLNSSVKYRLVIEDATYGPTNETSYTLSEGLATGKYSWKVIAEDNDGLTRNSKSFSLIVGTPLAKFAALILY